MPFYFTTHLISSYILQLFTQIDTATLPRTEKVINIYYRITCALVIIHLCAIYSILLF